jgi:hypothetical protein
MTDDIGHQLALEGMNRAWRNAETDWKATAAEVIERLADNPQGFTSDDVLRELASLQCSTHDNRALGGLMRTSAKELRLKKVGLEESTRPERHRGIVARWRAEKFC